MATHQGKVHDYLGMIFDFSAKGKVMFTMMDHIKKIIKSCPEEVTGTVHFEGPISSKDVARGASNGVPLRNSSTPATPVSETFNPPLPF